MAWRAYPLAIRTTGFPLVSSMRSLVIVRYDVSLLISRESMRLISFRSGSDKRTTILSPLLEEVELEVNWTPVLDRLLFCRVKSLAENVSEITGSLNVRISLPAFKSTKNDSRIGLVLSGIIA